MRGIEEERQAAQFQPPGDWSVVARTRQRIQNSSRNIRPLRDLSRMSRPRADDLRADGLKHRLQIERDQGLIFDDKDHSPEKVRTLQDVPRQNDAELESTNTRNARFA